MFFNKAFHVILISININYVILSLKLITIYYKNKIIIKLYQLIKINLIKNIIMLINL